MKSKALKSTKGITLIALVITIIVLLILAGVSISLVVGNNGVLSQASNSVTKTNEEELKETIELAYVSAQMEKGENYLDGVSANDLQTALAQNGVTGVNVTGEAGNLTVTATSASYKVVDGVATKIENDNGNYSVNEEITPAPQKLFDWEVISENERTAKITGIKSEYICKKDDAYYVINDENVTDTLVVPYEIVDNNNAYTVTEVILDCVSTNQAGEVVKAPLPDVKRIIYPNTVIAINSNVDGKNAGYGYGGWENYLRNVLETVILPNSLQTIGKCIFSECSSLKYITIPNTVNVIDEYAFAGCPGLTNITIPSSVTSIGDSAFACCTGLTNITIPTSVTSIGNYAFHHCPGLTNITIPTSVTSIGYSAFYDCTGLTEVRFEHTTAPTFGSSCFYKYSGETTTFYFKNSTVASAFKSEKDTSSNYHYKSSYGTKSTNYSW